MNMRDKLNLSQQFPARHTRKPIPTNFAKNDAAIRALQLGKNRLKEIGRRISELPRAPPAKSRNAPRAEAILLSGGRYSSQENTPRTQRNSG